MNQTQAAAEIARRLNVNDEVRAIVKFVNGDVLVACEKDSGGRKGWRNAGNISVGETIAVSKKTSFEFRYSYETVAAAIEGIEYTYQPTQPASPAEIHAEKLADAARQFRAGRPVDDDLIVECVVRGYLTQTEAMNRDF